MKSRDRIQRIVIGAFLCLAASVAGAVSSGAGARTDILLKANWAFAREDIKGAEDPAFDDLGWQKVVLPHTFNAVDGEKGGPYYRGPAWYRDRVVLPGPLICNSTVPHWPPTSG